MSLWSGPVFSAPLCQHGEDAAKRSRGVIYACFYGSLDTYTIWIALPHTITQHQAMACLIPLRSPPISWPQSHARHHRREVPQPMASCWFLQLINAQWIFSRLAKGRNSRHGKNKVNRRTCSPSSVWPAKCNNLRLPQFNLHFYACPRVA